MTTSPTLQGQPLHALTIHQALAAVDTARAVNIDGSPLLPAEL